MSKNLNNCPACGYPAKSREECFECGYVPRDKKQSISCPNFTYNSGTPKHCYICGVPKEHHKETFDTLNDELLESNEAYAIERLMLTEKQFDESQEPN